MVHQILGYIRRGGRVVTGGIRTLNELMPEKGSQTGGNDLLNVE
mgnify:CR=1 FL=1